MNRVPRTLAIVLALLALLPLPWTALAVILGVAAFVGLCAVIYAKWA